MARILVLGATGYTGGLAVDAMVLRGMRPVLVGRRASSLERVSKENGGLEIQLADATDQRSIEDLLMPGDVLVTTVGPFERVGFAVAAASASKGAHYVDSTGEVGFVRDLQRRLHTQAAATGSTMLPAFGYDYVPGILAGGLAMKEAPRANRLEIGYFATGSVRHGLSQGTRTTMAEGLTTPTITWRDGRLLDVRTASGVQTFPIRSTSKTAFLVSGTEVLFLPQNHPSLRSVDVYNGWFPAFSRLISAASVPANLLARTRIGTALISNVGDAAAGPPGGPDARERSRTRTHAVARGIDDAGEVASEVHVEGPSIYSLTGELLALAVELLADGRARTSGIVSPTDAFGLDVLAEQSATVGLTRVRE